MATLYWGGGTGTWDGFTTDNWYTDFARLTLSTRAPSAEDDVVFDSVSNATAYTVTIANNTTVCRNVTIAGPATGNLTLAGTGSWFIYGNLTFPATGFTRTFAGGIIFYGTGSHTITTNGVNLPFGISFSGNGTYTLLDALTTTSSISINAGTFNTDGKNLTCSGISAAEGTGAGTLTLGASTVSTTSITLNAPLTINAGTSNITFTSTAPVIGGGTNYTGNTFNNVTFSSTSISDATFYGNNTFNNLTFTTPSSARVNFVSLYGNQTVTGTLTIAGADGAKRYFVRSDTIGTSRTLTVGTVSSLVDVDFSDITVAGASAPWSGTRLGNCLGNTNITFGAGANKYVAAATSSSNWSSNIWSSTSGGSASTSDFPLAQDTVIIDDAGLNASVTLTLDTFYNIGGFDSSGRTNAMTFAGGSASPFCYGSINIGANVTSTISGAWTYCGRTTQNITTNSKTWTTTTINSPGGTVVFLDNFNIGTTRNIILTNGTLNCNDKNVTCGIVNATGNASKTLTLGSGLFTTTNGVGSATASNLTVTSNTATITTSSSASIGFTSVTATFGGSITVNGVGSLATIRGTTTVANLTIANAPTATSVTNKLILAGDLTVTGTLALAGGSSATQRAFVGSDTPGTQRTITAATVTGLTDIDFRDIAAAGASAPWSGTRLGNCQGNSNITFVAGTNKYWNLAGTQNFNATGWATSSGGTPAVNNFPLAQDTCVFDNAGSADTVTLNAAWNIKTIDASTRTSAMTLAGTGTVSIYGDVTYGSGVTSTASGSWQFRGTTTQSFTTAGKTLANAITVNNPSCSFQHGDAYTSTNSIAVTIGNYSTQNYNISVVGFSSSNSDIRSITLGTSTVTCSGTQPITFTNSVGLTFSGESSTINLSSTSLKTFNGGSQTFGIVSSTGGTTNPLTIAGSNTFGTLTNSARTYLRLTAGTTQTVTNFTYTGDVSNVVRWYTSIPGQRATLKGNSGAVGTNSVNGGNNSGLTFTGTSPDYFYVKDIAYSANYNGGPNFFMFF
jgi:hypothetical protein